MSSMRITVGQIVRRILVGAVVASVLVIPSARVGTDEARAAGGISTQTIVSVSTGENGSQLVVQRLVIEPGVMLAQHSFPGPSTFVVLSGTLQTTLVRGGAAVSRGPSDQNAPIGATMNLSAGQVISYSPGAVMTVANLRSERLVLIVSTLAGADEDVGGFS